MPARDLLLIAAVGLGAWLGAHLQASLTAVSMDCRQVRHVEWRQDTPLLRAHPEEVTVTVCQEAR